MRLNFLVLLFATLSIARPSPRAGHVVHESRNDILPPGWERTSRLNGELIIPVSVAIKQKNLHRLEEMMFKVASPDSPHYSQHFSADEIIETFAPSQKSIDTVRGWLEAYGLAPERVKLSRNKAWFHVDMKISEAEEIFATEYHLHTHSSGKKHIACDSYSVPHHVQPHIDFLLPSVSFDTNVVPQFQKRDLADKITPSTDIRKGDAISANSIPDDLYNCDTQITPICLQTLYSITGDASAAAVKKNSYGIVEYTPQSYLPTDLDMFFKQFAPELVGRRPNMDSIDGGNIQTSNQSFGLNGESDLDLQYAMTLVYPLIPTLYQTGDFVEGASFNNFLDGIDATYCTYEGGDDPTQDGIYPDQQSGGYKGREDCGTFSSTNVISTSYGYNEADLTPFYEERQCNEYAKLGLMGVTVLYSSGDYGVAGNDGLCLNPDGTQTLNGTRFNPSFPGTCPYVTSVGATQIKPNATVYDPEEACETVIYSGGGFSNVFERPDYQKIAVKNYFDNYPPTYSSGEYNTSISRGFPDVSANGANYVVAVDGNFTLVYGTSASSPTFGSVITLVNNARIAAGKKPVGFLNPAIYSEDFHEAFNDITSGGNQGCGTPGFTAVPGWDPVTGLGTPNYGMLKEKFLSLP